MMISCIYFIQYINIHSIIFNKNEKNVLSNSSDNQIIEYSIDQMKFNIFENIEYSLNVKNCQFINCNLETKRLEYMLSYYGALLKRKY